MRFEGGEGGKRKPNVKMGEMSVDSSDGQKCFGEKRFLIQKKVW